MDKLLDRRVRKTRQVLRRSLSVLMRQKPVNKISVRELTELCDINRGTFYLHYRDVFDMVEKFEKELFEDLREILSKYSAQTPESLRDMLRELYTYLDENRDLCGALLGKYGNSSFVRSVTDLARDKFLYMWTGPRTGDEKLSERAFWFMVSGSIGMLRDWLDDANPEPSREIANLTCRIVLGGIPAAEHTKSKPSAQPGA